MNPALVAAALVVVPTLVGALWARRRLLVVTVYGRSMTPTYHGGDRLLVRRQPVTRLRAGAVIVFRSPDRADPDLVAEFEPERVRYVMPDTRLLIKRVVAAPGDPVPVERVPVLAGLGHDTVPAGMVVVLGDNPHVSHDSRAYGYLPVELIVGVATRAVGR
ncbi:S26 family signal peptidase [Micromonospora sp. CA-249363]|uniref:S26 family signal peptidase n=1 Tax=Micromonospora sp. CA-249363 TaxID=3239963 RepID=UPI003D9338DB